MGVSIVAYTEPRFSDNIMAVSSALNPDIIWAPDPIDRGLYMPDHVTVVYFGDSNRFSATEVDAMATIFTVIAASPLPNRVVATHLDRFGPAEQAIIVARVESAGVALAREQVREHYSPDLWRSDESFVFQPHQTLAYMESNSAIARIIEDATGPYEIAPVYGRIIETKFLAPEFGYNE